MILSSNIRQNDYEIIENGLDLSNNIMIKNTNKKSHGIYLQD